MDNLITSLRETWGLSDSDIARAMHTRPSVIRHWRNGAEPDAAEIERVDRLDEFCDNVREVDCEPAVLLSAPLVEGYTATGWDLYVAGRPELLLAHARGELSAEETLTAFDPNWRSHYWTSLTTFVAEDGNLSTRGKTYEEVRSQTR